MALPEAKHKQLVNEIVTQRREVNQMLDALHLPDQTPLQVSALRTFADEATRVLAEKLLALTDREPQEEMSHLKGDVPIVLLPARLETRWDPIEPALLIRIYPDEIAAAAHQDVLSADEVAAGEAWWKTKNSTAGWQQLVDAVGAPRAAWIARTFSKARAVDEAAAIPSGRQSAPARAYGLPDRWIATGYIEFADSQAPVFQVAGLPISDPLNLSPDTKRWPASAAGEDLVDAGMKWLIDFEAARQVGMGLRVRKADLRLDVWDSVFKVKGLYRLIVVGVRTASSLEDSVAELRSLLEKHHYGSGLAIVPAGTPTNTTAEGGRSGYSSQADDLGPFTHERSLRAGEGRVDTIWPRSKDDVVSAGRWDRGGAQLLSGLGLLPSAPHPV